MLFAIRESWTSDRRGRMLAQAAFAVLLVSGTYIVSTGAGGKAGDRIAPESTQALKGDRQSVLHDASPVPAALASAALASAALETAAMEPAAPVAVPPPKPALAAVKPEAVKPRKAMALPAGVERYDSCRAPCDSRDPLVRRTDAPARFAALAEPGVPVQSTAPSASAPVQTSAPVQASAPAQPSGGLLPDGGGLLADTVTGTQAAIGKMREAVQTVVDVVW